MALNSSFEVGTDRLFLTIVHGATHRREFFKRKNVGKNSFLSLVKNECKDEGIEGSRIKNWVTNHRLRRTLDTVIFESGH